MSTLAIRWASIPVTGDVRPEPRQGHRCVLIDNGSEPANVRNLQLEGQRPLAEIGAEMDIREDDTRRTSLAETTRNDQERSSLHTSSDCGFHTRQPGSTTCPTSSSPSRCVEGLANETSSKADGVKMALFWGGDFGICEQNFAFDFESSSWAELLIEGLNLHGGSSETSRPIAPCAGFAVTTAPDRVYMFGGVEEGDGFDNVSNQLVEYRVSTNTIFSFPDNDTFPEPRACASINYVPPSDTCPDPCVYMFGGIVTTYHPMNDLHVFNLRTGRWSRPSVAGTPPEPRESHSAVYFPRSPSGSRKLVIYGGHNTSELKRLRDVVYLNLDSMCWERPSVKGNIPQGRSQHSAHALGTKMVVFGGLEEDPMAKQWLSTKNQMGAIAFEARRKRRSNEVHVFDTETGFWQQTHISAPDQELPLPLLPAPRHGHSSIMVDNQMVVFGGSTGDAPRSSSNDEPDGSGGNHDGNDDDEIRFEGLDDLWCMEIGPPFPPGPLSVMRVEDNSIHVQWTDRRRLRLPSERSFRLLIREKHNALQQDAADRGNPWCTAYEGPDMSFVIKEYLSTPAMTTTVQQKVRIQPLTEYEVRVLAVNFAGDSSFWDDKNYSDHVEDGGRLSWRRSSDSSSPVCIRTTGPSISPRDVKARRLPISSVRATSGNGWVPDSPSAESVEVVEESCVLMEWLPHEMPNHKTASTDGIMVHKYVIEVCCTLVASTSADDAELGSRYGQREQPMSEDGLEARVRKKARVDPAGDLPAAQAGRRNESEKLQPQNPQQRANGKIPSTQNGNASPPSQMTVDSPKVVTVNERVDNRGESVTQRRAIISTGWRHFRELNARGPLDENGSRQAISMVLPIRDLTENVVRPAYAQHFSSSPQGSIPEVDRDENKAPLPNGLGPRTLKRKRGPTPQSGSVEASTTNTDERFDSSSQHQHHHPSWPPLENVEVELRFQVVGETRTGYRSEPAKATYYEDLEATSPSPLRSPAPVPMATRTLDCIKFVISAPEPTSLATYPHKVPFTPHGYKVLSALLDQVPQMQTTSTASTATTSQTHIDDTSELCNVEGPRVNQEITSMSSSDLSLPDTLDATCGGREEAGVQNDKILTLCEDGDDLRAEGKGSALSKSRLASNRDMNHLDSGVSTENVPFRAMVQKQAGDENVGVLDLHDVGPQTLSASTTSDRAAPALQTPQEGAESTTDQLLEDGTSSTTCPESLQQNTTDHTNQEQERHLADRREEQGNSLMSSVPSTAVVHISSAGDLGIPSCPTSPPSSHVTNEDLSIGEEFRFMDSAAGGVLFPEEEESAVLVESLHMQLPQPLLDTTSVNADLNEAASIIETLTSPPHLSNSAKPPVTSTGGKLELAADKISSSAEVDEPIEMEVDVEKAGAKRGLVSDSGTPLDGSKMSDSGKETQQQNAGALAMDMDVKIGARDGLGKCVSASHTGVGRPTVSDEVAMEIETKEHDQAPELNPLAATAGAVSTTGVSADQMQVDVEGDGANGGTIERSDRIEEEVWGDKSTETSKPEIPLVFVSEEKKTAGTQSKSDLSNGDIVQQQHEKRSMPIEAGLPTPATNLSEDSLPLLVNATTPPGTNIATRTISTKTKSIDGRTKPSPSISPPMDNISLSASLPVNDKSDGSISSPLPSAPLDTTKPPPGTPVRGDDKDSATTSTTPEKTGTLPPHPPTWHFNFRYGDFLRARWVRELEAGTSDAGKGGKGGKGVKVDKAGKVANVGPSGQDNSHEFYLARVLHYIVGLDDSIKLKVHWVGFQGAQSKAVIDLTPPATDCRHRGEQLTEAAEEEWRKYLDTRLRKDETTTRTKYDEQALQIDKFDRKPKRVSQELKDQVERGEVPIVLESTSSSRSSTPTVAQTKTKGKSAKGGKTAAPQKKGRKSLG